VFSHCLKIAKSRNKTRNVKSLISVCSLEIYFKCSFCIPPVQYSTLLHVPPRMDDSFCGDAWVGSWSFLKKYNNVPSLHMYRFIIKAAKPTTFLRFAHIYVLVPPMYNLDLRYVYFAHNQGLKTLLRVIFWINHDVYQLAAR